MDTFDMNLEADCDLEVVADVGHDRLPLRLALRSDTANIVDALLTLRALQALDRHAACYPVYWLPWRPPPGVLGSFGPRADVRSTSCSTTWHCAAVWQHTVSENLRYSSTVP